VQQSTGVARMVQRSVGSPAGGCGLCYGNTKEVGKAAHKLAQAAMMAKYPYLVSELPFKGPDLKPPAGVDPEGGAIDLAEISSDLSTVEIGEIKPANVAGKLEGDSDLLWYEGQLKNLGVTVQRLNLAPPADPIPFPTLAPLDCPQMQGMFIGRMKPPDGIYGYYCEPDFKELILECDCKKGRRKKDDIRQPKDVPIPVPVPKPDVKPIPVPDTKGDRPPVTVPDVPIRPLAVVPAPYHLAKFLPEASLIQTSHIVLLPVPGAASSLTQMNPLGDELQFIVLIAVFSVDPAKLRDAVRATVIRVT
jgi:hypothetical protein